TERFNHTLTDMIACYVNPSHTDWDRLLPFLTYAYNISPQASHGFSPYRLVYGRDPVSTVDRLFPVLPVSDSSVFSSSTFSVAQSARRLARSLLLRTHEYLKCYYDSSRRDVSFSVGDQVWLHIPTRRTGLATKLLPKFYGPFTILRCLGPVT